MKCAARKSFRSFIVSFVLFLCSYTPLSAGPVIHALLTDHFFRLVPKYDDSEKEAFRAGSLFSDIRYLGQLSCTDSYSNATLQDILNEPSPFIAGMMFHDLVDSLRENFVVQGNHHQLLADLSIEHPSTYLKFLEDEIIFPSLEKSHWKDLVKNIHPDERLWGVDEEVLKRWHYLLDLSFSYYPSTLIFLAHLKGKGLLNVSPEELAIWYATFEPTAKRDDVKTYVTNLFKMFASQVKQ
jgi:hypothetical protein